LGKHQTAQYALMIMVSTEHQTPRRLRENGSAALDPQTDQKSLAHVTRSTFTEETSSAALRGETYLDVADGKTGFEGRFLSEIVMNCNAKKMPA
jgi:hypothetical protein